MNLKTMNKRGAELMGGRAMVLAMVSGMMLAIGAAAVAGPLAPPAGPVGSTGKTLTEVEPRVAMSQATTPGDADSVMKITASGSYYLTQNITVPSGDSGILITASNVTLDLNGFRIIGQIGSLNGVRVTGDRAGVQIRNGTIANTGGFGIDMTSGGTCIGAIIESVTVTNGAGGGFDTGSSSIVRNCTATNNVGNGFFIGTSSVISGCTASGNDAGGFIVGNNSRLVDCSADGNGVLGYLLGSAVSVTGCTAATNAGAGFASSANGVNMIGCTARGNTGNGFDLQNKARVDGCTASSNGDDGIRVAADCMVTDSHSSENQGDGFVGDDRTVMMRNHAAGNGVSAMVTGAGFRVIGQSMRVEGNHSSANERGFELVGSRNLLIRNTAAGNTVNYNVSGQNIYAPTIDQTGAGQIGFFGNSAVTDATGTTHPNANFSF